MAFTVSYERAHAQSLACIFSLSGFVLTQDERELFTQSKPLGFILFSRNIDTPQQLKELVAALKDCVGWDCPILIDQEGGRVQRLKPPHWQVYKPMKYYGDLYRAEPAKAISELKNDTDRLCADLINLGIQYDCAPVLDVLAPQTHAVIGDRAFSDDPQIVAVLGAVVSERFIANHIMPIIKHIPGHGRAAADSHLELPVVDAPLNELSRVDFAPFAALSRQSYGAGLWAMSAHVIYSAIDAAHPASTSRKVIEEIIRGEIGFEGVLVSDDLDMKALDIYGDVARRCTLVLEAGCDVALYCSGKLEAMRGIAEICPKISENTQKRLQNGLKMWDVAA